MALLGPLILAAAGAAIAQYFQDRSWKHKQLEEKKASELKIAMDLFQSVTTKVDTRYQTMQWVWWGFHDGVDADEMDTKRWPAYQEILHAWKVNYSTQSALVLLYFGKATSDLLYTEIEGTFDSLSKKLGALRYQKLKPAEQQKLIEQYSVESLSFAKRIHEFNVVMTSQLQHGQVGLFLPQPKDAKYRSGSPR